MLLGAFAGRCTAIAWNDSITSDEVVYLTHGLHFWMTGDDLGMWELGTPRLPHVLSGLAPYLVLRSADGLPSGVDEQSLNTELRRLVLSGSNGVLVPARLVAIGWGMGLIVAVYWVVSRAGTSLLGFVAAALVSLTPEVIAHSSIAGSDLPFTTTAFIALIVLAHYTERPTLRRWLVLSLAIGLAWSMRHTGIVLIAVAVVVHFLVHVRRIHPRGLGDLAEGLCRSIWAGVGLATLAFLVLWAGDGFGGVTVAEMSQRVSWHHFSRRVGTVDPGWVRVPTSLLSFLKQVRHQNAGHEAYFLGTFGTTGWWSYFPLAFLLKTPIGLLALLVLAAARVRPRSAWDVVALGFLGLLWVLLVRNKVDIGLRYALLTYPLAATFVARLFAPGMLRDRVWGPITLVAAAWFALASLGCGSRCLSYFNEIGGGPQHGWLYLADSNLDWGQDFDALADTVRKLGIDEITTDLSSERRLDQPNVLAIVLPGKALQVPVVTPPNRRLYDSDGGYVPVHTRYVAVSVSHLMGLYSGNDVSWLRTRRLVARVGDSTFLFDMDHPAEAPFLE